MVKQGGVNYLWFIAVLSTAIGMINLFPIPVLDGGHLLFFAIEALTGKKPDPKIINKFMTLGFFILISLMLFSIFNDFLCPLTLHMRVLTLDLLPYISLLTN